MKKHFFALAADARLDAGLDRYVRALVGGARDRGVVRQTLFADVSERSTRSVALDDQQWVALQADLQKCDPNLRRLSAQVTLAPPEAEALAAGLQGITHDDAALLAGFLAAAAKAGATVVVLAG